MKKNVMTIVFVFVTLIVFRTSWDYRWNYTINNTISVEKPIKTNDICIEKVLVI